MSTTTSTAQFQVIGIAVRTSNDPGKAAIDIPQLWARLFSESIAKKIPNKVDDNIYCIYTDYELDYTKPYTCILGYKVNSLDSIPAGLTGKTIDGGNYTVFHAKGKLADGIVFQEWTKIWNSAAPRAYTSDYEVYGAEAQNPDDVVVPIFIATK